MYSTVKQICINIFNHNCLTFLSKGFYMNINFGDGLAWAFDYLKQVNNRYQTKSDNVKKRNQSQVLYNISFLFSCITNDIL